MSRYRDGSDVMTHSDDDISVYTSATLVFQMNRQFSDLYILVSLGGFFALKYILNSRLWAVSSSKSSRMVSVRPVRSMVAGVGCGGSSCTWGGCSG